MIRFQVDSRGYKIEWMDEPYQQLYMFYEPKGKLFQYEGQSVRSIQYDPKSIIYQTYILVPPVDHATQGTHDRMLPIGNYRCSLYSDRNRSGNPLRWVDVFIGTQIEVVMRREAYRDGFEYLYVECYCGFPRSSIWLTFEETPVVRIYLPVMNIRGNYLYSTGCIVPHGAYDRLTVAFSQDICDCIRVRKN